MAHFKVFLFCLLAAAATGEPPVPGYNYQQPAQNSYHSPSNSYLPPSTGFSAPSNSYLPPTFGGHQDSFNHGQQNHGQYANHGQQNHGQYANHGQQNHGQYANHGQQNHGQYANHGQHGNEQHAHGHGHDHEVPKSYEFGYSVKDAQSGNDYGRKESSDGNEVRGEYRVQLPDGRTQIVTYHADWQTGFHADVRYEGEATYPEPTYNNRHQGGYNYNAPQEFTGSLTGFNNNYKQPSTAYGPPSYH